MLNTEERLARYRIVLDDAAQGGNRPVARPGKQIPDRRRLIPIAAALMLVVGVGTALAVSNNRDTPDDGRATQPTSAGFPAAPIGTWRRAAAPPFPMHASMRAETTADGRVVVLGPTPHSEPADFEGGIYTPATDTWELIPPAPLTDGGTFEVAGNVVVAVTDESPTVVRAAWLDLRTMHWTAIDVPAAVGTSVYPWIFDGETLVFADTGKTVGAEPSTLRWSLADQTWRAGKPFPLVPRQYPAVAKGDGRVAMWGGSTNGDSSTAVTDGAIYNVADDSWTVIPSDPDLTALSQSRPAAVLTGASLTVVGGLVQDQPRQAATYDGTAWHPLTSPTAMGYMADGTMAATIVVDSANDGTNQTVQYLDLGASVWRDAPYQTLVPFHEDLLALSAYSANSGSGPFRASLLQSGVWRSLTDAPFANRMEPAIAVVGDLVVVVGGDEGTDLSRKQDAWVLDLSH